MTFSLSMKQISNQVNIKKLLTSTIEDVIFKKNVWFAKTKIAIHILRIIQAAVVSLVPMSHLCRVLIFDYMRYYKLPNEFNIVAISTISIAAYFTKVLHFQAGKNKFITLPYFIWVKQNFYAMKIFDKHQNAQILKIVNKTSNLFIKMIKMFYFSFGKFSIWF